MIAQQMKIHLNHRCTKLDTNEYDTTDAKKFSMLNPTKIISYSYNT